MTVLLDVTGLSRPPLGPLDLRLHAGECVAVQGPSGAGKTLLLRALADLDPAQGVLQLSGVGRERFDGPGWRRRVAYLPAEPGWWAETGAEHLRDPAAAAPLLERVGLDGETVARPVAQLSTGERQRLALVRALERDPVVLLLDEPTAALDPDNRSTVEALVAERLAGGGGALWVSHDREQEARVADRVLRLVAGRLVAGGAEASP